MTDKRNDDWPGYDSPLHRDWLFVVTLVLAGAVAITGYVRGGSSLWIAFCSLGGSLFLIGLVLGSVRAFIRGYREPPGH